MLLINNNGFELIFWQSKKGNININKYAPKKVRLTMTLNVIQLICNFSRLVDCNLLVLDLSYIVIRHAFSYVSSAFFLFLVYDI